MRWIRFLLLALSLGSFFVVWTWKYRPATVQAWETRWIEHETGPALRAWESSQAKLQSGDEYGRLADLDQVLLACEGLQIGDRNFGIWRKAIRARAQLATRNNDLRSAERPV